MIELHFKLFSLLLPFVKNSLIFGFTGGFFLFFVFEAQRFEKKNLEAVCIMISGFTLLAPLGWGLLKFFFEANYLSLVLYFVGAAVGFCLAIYLERKYLGLFEKKLKEHTKNSDLEREGKTDIRKISGEAGEAYDPKKYFKEGAWFLGLDQTGAPIYHEGKTLPHVEVCGMTGSGKGVVLGVIASQCVEKGEAVFILDPKNDEWFPHVAHAAAKNAGAKYQFIDLTAEEYQFNIFEGASRAEVEELLIAGFELGDRGQASDFYKIADRKMARFIADQMKKGETAQTLFAEHSKFLEKEAEGFAGKFRELAEITAINSKTGLSLKKIVEEGGLVYVVGSMRNTKITRIQKMLLVRLIQIAEKRDRIEGGLRQICVVLDELKYHLSRTALEALGASRDKGLHVVMAHQSVADLRDCPNDLEPEAVVGAVLENTKIKMVYRVEMPETAEIFAKKSGKILVDEEIRFIDRSTSLVEHVKPHRNVRQSERFLVDENMFLSLPNRCCVVFGVGLPEKVYTSPQIVEKTRKSIEVVKSEGTEAEGKGGIIEVDFEKLG